MLILVLLLFKTLSNINNNVSMLTVKNYTIHSEKKSIIQNLEYAFTPGKTYAIMGPNGSGKSTFALSLSGSKNFTLDSPSQAFLGTEEITAMEPHERAQKGLFVSFQSPPDLSGITVFSMLRTALHGKIPALELKQSIESHAEKLHIPKELLSRSLNDGFSGGERKKMELLQMAILDPFCSILDEIDTGVDIDALKVMSTFLLQQKSPKKTFIIITHRPSFARSIQVDTVLVLKKGVFVAEGDLRLLETIEKEGYTNI